MMGESIFKNPHWSIQATIDAVLQGSGIAISRSWTQEPIRYSNPGAAEGVLTKIRNNPDWKSVQDVQKQTCLDLAVAGFIGIGDVRSALKLIKEAPQLVPGEDSQKTILNALTRATKAGLFDFAIQITGEKAEITLASIEAKIFGEVITDSSEGADLKRIAAERLKARGQKRLDEAAQYQKVVDLEARNKPIPAAVSEVVQSAVENMNNLGEVTTKLNDISEALPSGVAAQGIAARIGRLWIWNQPKNPDEYLKRAVRDGKTPLISMRNGFQQLFDPAHDRTPSERTSVAEKTYVDSLMAKSFATNISMGNVFDHLTALVRGGGGYIMDIGKGLENAPEDQQIEIRRAFQDVAVFLHDIAGTPLEHVFERELGQRSISKQHIENIAKDMDFFLHTSASEIIKPRSEDSSYESPEIQEARKRREEGKELIKQIADTYELEVASRKAEAYSTLPVAIGRAQEAVDVELTQFHLQSEKYARDLKQHENGVRDIGVDLLRLKTRKEMVIENEPEGVWGFKKRKSPDQVAAQAADLQSQIDGINKQLTALNANAPKKPDDSLERVLEGKKSHLKGLSRDLVETKTGEMVDRGGSKKI